MISRRVIWRVNTSSSDWLRDGMRERVGVVVGRGVRAGGVPAPVRPPLLPHAALPSHELPTGRALGDGRGLGVGGGLTAVLRLGRAHGEHIFRLLRREGGSLESRHEVRAVHFVGGRRFGQRVRPLVVVARRRPRPVLVMAAEARRPHHGSRRRRAEAETLVVASLRLGVGRRGSRVVRLQVVGALQAIAALRHRAAPLHRAALALRGRPLPAERAFGGRAA